MVAYWAVKSAIEQGVVFPKWFVIGYGICVVGLTIFTIVLGYMVFKVRKMD